MKEKTNKWKEIASQIEYIDTKMKNINEELDHIKKINQILISNIQELIE